MDEPCCGTGGVGVWVGPVRASFLGLSNPPPERRLVCSFSSSGSPSPGPGTRRLTQLRALPVRLLLLPQGVRGWPSPVLVTLQRAGHG